MATQQGSSKWILAAVFLIIAAILAAQLPAAGVDRYTKTAVTDEVIDISSTRMPGGGINASITLTIANPPTSWKVTECPIAGVVYSNSTSNFAVTTDYTLAATTGVLTLVNSTAMYANPENSTLIDYTYCSDDYVTLAWGRTAIQLTYGFFALGAFGIALTLMYSIWKESGLMQ